MNKTRSFSHIIVSIEESLQQQIHFNGNICGNKCCRCNEDSLLWYFILFVLENNILYFMQS